MLKEYLLKTKIGNFIPKINNFFYSNYFIITVCVLVLFSVFFGLEVPLFICYALFAIVITFLCDDMLPTIPLICCGYMTISRKNNPIDNPDNIYDKPGFWVALGIIIAVIVVCLISRLVFELKKGKKRKPRLTYGFIALGIVLICGGLGTEFYSFKTVAYGLLVILSLCLFYFYLYYTVDWTKAKSDYFAYTLLIIGIMMIFQVGSMYVFYNGPTDYIDRGHLKTGWGITNNVGSVVAMCIPAGFYLSFTKKHGWIYTIFANLIYVATLFTQSRNSMLIGTAIYILCLILSVVFSKKNWWKNLVANASCLLVYFIVFVLIRDKIDQIFGTVISIGLNNNGRFSYYSAGINAFKFSPLFGTGFFDYKHSWNVYLEGSFLAPRYHSTIIQMMASTGVVGCIAYSFHRIQTFRLLFKRFTLNKLFVGFCIGVILVNSLIDCMFFNFGPGLHYACLLVMLEGLAIKEEAELKSIENDYQNDELNS